MYLVIPRYMHTMLAAARLSHMSQSYSNMYCSTSDGCTVEIKNNIHSFHREAISERKKIATYTENFSSQSSIQQLPTIIAIICVCVCLSTKEYITYFRLYTISTYGLRIIFYWQFACELLMCYNCMQRGTAYSSFSIKRCLYS